MKDGQYIYVEDKFGVCIGRVVELYSEDQIGIRLLSESIKETIKVLQRTPNDKSISDTLMIDLRKVKTFKLYETQEELIENHFEYFL